MDCRPRTARVLFMGTPDFALPSLKALSEEFEVQGVVSQPDRPAGRGKKVSPTPVKRLAKELGLEVYQPEKKGELIELVEELSPDCVVVVAYGRILPKEVLEIPKYGALNLHASLLPKYRGAAPVQRAIIAGDRETGNTVMLINERMDAGDILAQQREVILPEDNARTLSERLASKGATLLVETLKKWLGGGLKPVPQREEEATYAPPISKEELRICWKAQAQSVVDRIRGLYPNAYTTFRGSRIKILKAEPLELQGEPAEILENKRLVVACGRGAVLVRELISPKGKLMKGEDFMRGYSPSVGERFT